MKYNKPTNDLSALEGTPEHGWVKVSRAWFEDYQQSLTLSGYILQIDWGEPDEDGCYEPSITRVENEEHSNGA